jgi:hypothetical protein
MGHGYWPILTALALLAGTARGQSVQIVIAADTVVAADIVVDSVTTCRILPGVTIRFDGYRQVRVRGMLIAEGTRERPIRITAVERPHGSAERPSWQGLSVVGRQAYARLRHCRIEGAFANGFWESESVLDSCEIVGNYRGIYCGRGARPHIRGCRIYRNVIGVTVNQGAPLLLGNVITENGLGMQVESGSESVAVRNTLARNGQDLHVDQTLQKADTAMPVQRLWDVMRRLY